MISLISFIYSSLTGTNPIVQKRNKTRQDKDNTMFLKNQVSTFFLLALVVVTPAIVYGKKSEDEKLFGKSFEAAEEVWKDYVVDKDDDIMDYSYEYYSQGSSADVLYIHVRDGKVESALPANPKPDEGGPGLDTH